MSTKELKKTINMLIAHNNWRRGGDDAARAQHPTDIGVAIDHAIDVLVRVENLIFMRNRCNNIESELIALTQAAYNDGRI